jgi:integrase/recombinase XerD
MCEEVVDRARQPAIQLCFNRQGLLDLWLHGRSLGARRAYEADARAFLAHAGKAVRQVTVGDVQAFGDSMESLATATRARRLSAVKSLLSFAHRIGYVPFNVGVPVKLPSIKATLAERIMGEADVLVVVRSEPDRRNAAILQLTYIAGLRVSEVCGLSWRDMQPREGGGQVTIYGKGGKTRAVLLPVGVWKALAEIRGAAGPDDPVSARSGGVASIRPQFIAWSRRRRLGLVSRPRSPRTGCAMPMPRMLWTVARRSTLCSRPSAMPALPPPADTSTRGRPTAAPDTWRSDVVAARPAL